MERLKCSQALEMVNQSTGLEYQKMYQTEKIALAKSAFLTVTERENSSWFPLVSQAGNLLAEQTLDCIDQKEKTVAREIELLRQSLPSPQQEEFDQLLTSLEKARKRSCNGLAGARKRWALYRQQKEIEALALAPNNPVGFLGSLRQKASLVWEENFSSFKQLFSFFKRPKNNLSFWQREKENLRYCLRSIRNVLANAG